MTYYSTAHYHPGAAKDRLLSIARTSVLRSGSSLVSAVLQILKTDGGLHAALVFLKQRAPTEPAARQLHNRIIVQCQLGKSMLI